MSVERKNKKMSLVCRFPAGVGFMLGPSDDSDIVKISQEAEFLFCPSQPFLTSAGYLVFKPIDQTGISQANVYLPVNDSEALLEFSKEPLKDLKMLMSNGQLMFSVKQQLEILSVIETFVKDAQTSFRIS